MRTAPAAARTAQPPPAGQAPPRPASPAGELLDQVTADTLRLVWSGTAPAVVVKSPPGAGKTRLVVTIAGQLAARGRMAIAVATQTRDQAVDLTNRAAAQGLPVGLLGGKSDHRPAALAPGAGYFKGQARLPVAATIVVATAARWMHTDARRFAPDVLIVDEAYQMTYATLGAIGGLAGQLLLVGDPGQIDPVVTARTHRWATWPHGPQQPAPLALAAAHPEQVTHRQLHRTWRLGATTTALIQPEFYPELPFTSARPPRDLLLDGVPEAEVAALPITPYSPDDPAIAHAAANRVRTLLRTGQVRAGQVDALRPEDVAVLAPHRSQVGLVSALLADLPEVLVATVNAAQGLEREAVVVIHPLAGYRDLAAFAVDPGRLCVALSRHRTHATVITDARSPEALAHARAEALANGRPDDTFTLHERVLTRLHAVEVTGSEKAP